MNDVTTRVPVVVIEPGEMRNACLNIAFWFRSVCFPIL